LEHIPEGNALGSEVKDYVDVKKQAEKLGYAIPDGVVLLPLTFESAQNPNDLIYAAGTDTVRKLLVQEGIPTVKLEQESPHLEKHALEWMGPVILFTAAAISQNPAIVSVTLGVISNYLTDWFRGVPKENRTASLKLVKETKGGYYKSLYYKGPAENLSQVKDILDRFDDEKQS
jgi:hypothetical protein